MTTNARIETARLTNEEIVKLVGTVPVSRAGLLAAVVVVADAATAKALQVQDAHVLALVAALRELAAFTGQTLLGGRSEPDPRRAHEDGANKAFEQCARIALTALKAAGEEPTDA